MKNTKNFLKSHYLPNKKTQNFLAAFFVLVGVSISSVEKIDLGNVAGIVTGYIAFIALQSWRHQKKADNVIKLIQSLVGDIFSVREINAEICYLVAQRRGREEWYDKNIFKTENSDYKARLTSAKYDFLNSNSDKHLSYLDKLLDTRSRAEASLFFLGLETENSFQKIIFYNSEEKTPHQVRYDFSEMLREAKCIIEERFPKEFELIFVKQK